MVFLRLFFYWLFFFQIRFAIGEPIETVYVSIEGDYSKLLDDVDEGADKAVKNLEKVESSGEKMGKGLKGSAAIAGAAFGLAATGAAALLNTVLKLAQAVPAFFQNMARQAIAANSQFETFTSQFTTLLGSADKAQERLDELARFGVETPFELPEIVEASRQLEVFGGATIATGKNLRLIGDLAAGVNQPIQMVAFWIGRMYDALQNGQPFGESALRLQEMGILSGDVRREIETMAKSGEDGTKVFETFAERVGSKFSGNMERLSKTLQGVQSNLADFQGNLLRVSGRELFEEFRQANIDLLKTLDENEAEITAIGSNLGQIGADLIRLARELSGGFDLKGILANVKQLTEDLVGVNRAAAAVITQIKAFVEAFVSFGLSASQTNENLEKTEGFLSRLSEVMVTGAQVLALSKAGWVGLLETIRPVLGLLKDVVELLSAVSTGQVFKAAGIANRAMGRMENGLFNIDAGIGAMEKSILDSSRAINEMVNPVEKLEEAVEQVKQDPIKAEDIVEEPDAIEAQIESLSNQMIDAVERRNEQLEQLQQSHSTKMQQIEQDAINGRIKINDDYANAVNELEESTAKRRGEIIKSSQEALSQLRKSTDDQLDKRRKDFNQKEQRETEDHLKEMRRLEDDYLFNLQDAVRSRDARAIIDLQRGFQQDSSRRQEDFDTNQGRSSQDFSQELDEIRQNERDRRDEILRSQTEQLAALQEHETQRLAELTNKRDEDLRQLEVNLQEKRDRENLNFQERQAQLDQALQNQLASMGQSLANQNEVSEEGARRVLETFNEYFGVGGDIDKIMADFAKRRNTRMELSVAFKQTGAGRLGRSSSSSRSSGSGRPRQSTQQIQQAAQTSGGITGTTGFTSNNQVPAFRSGGEYFTDKPTLALFGEGGPEWAIFRPATQMNGQNGISAPSFSGAGGAQRVEIEFKGSAPPGIGGTERDRIAGVLINALNETGILAQRG